MGENALSYLTFVRAGRVQNLLHNLKYRNVPEIGELLGKWYGSELQKSGYQEKFDLIVPVPLYYKKLRKVSQTIYSHVPVWQTSFLTKDHLCTLDQNYLMANTDNFNSFLSENKKLAKEYLDLKIEIGRLRLISMFSKTAGYIIWVIVMLFLFSLACTFLGLVAGFWFSDLTGSYVKGFGLATIGILLMIFLIIVLRRTLFVNPIIRTIIKKANEENKTN